MGKFKTHKEFENQVYDLVGNEYTILEEYKGTHKQIKMRHNCDKCKEYKWNIAPANFINGKRCPKCAGNAKKTQEEFIEEVYNLFGNEYSIIGFYKGNKIKVLVQHNHDKCDNHKWYISPDNLLRGNKCPKCDLVTRTGNIETFKNEVYNLVKNEYEILGDYVNSKTKILIKHNCEDGKSHTYETEPRIFLSGYRCPICNESKGEKSIRNLLLKNNINFYTQHKFEDCRDKRELLFDFMIINNNKLYCLIEYDGIQHFEWIEYFMTYDDFLQLQNRDRLKNEYCKRNNIKLIRIPYWDFDNIEEILNNELKEVLLNE